jgi:hypothetical protein
MVKVNSRTEEDSVGTRTSIRQGAQGHVWESGMPQPDAPGANLMDQVHHGGPLTIYLRQAGGKVPSIYGPSGPQSIPAY